MSKAKPTPEEESKALLDQLFAWLDDPQEETSVHTNRATDSSPEETTDSTKPFPFNEHYTKEIHQELIEFGEKLKRHHVPFFFAVVRGDDDITDPNADHASSYAMSMTMWMPRKLCEFLAMQEVVRLPHQFSHLVLDMAEKIDLIEKFDQFMNYLRGRDHDDDDDE